LVVGAYRDNEVRPFDPLMRTIDKIRKARARVWDVVLEPLALHDIERLIADSLHCEREHAQPLAQMVQEKTAGNPFFVIQFISALAEEGLIAFDQSKAAWNWDLARIRAKGFTDNVVDLMVGKLSRLPDKTQDALKLLACLGNTAEIASLTVIQGEAEGAIDSHMWDAVRAGLVFRLDRSYAFLHDRVQEAAYSLIPVDQRATVHLRIGRCLVAAMNNEKLTEPRSSPTPTRWSGRRISIFALEERPRRRLPTSQHAVISARVWRCLDRRAGRRATTWPSA
jgi:predicted ATPase